MEKLKLIIETFRPLRWYRNFLMVAGSVIALATAGSSVNHALLNIAAAFVALCFISSGNYGINEFVDRGTDIYHPEKKLRAVASGKVKKQLVIALSLFFYLCGFSIVLLFLQGISVIFFLFVVDSIFYNIPPLRLKDIPYADFFLEALNSPIRLAIGWYAVTSETISTSLILLSWFAGAFFMAAKRLSEVKYIGNTETAVLYRKSLSHYSEKKLLLAMAAAFGLSMYMFGMFSAEHSIDLAILLPFVIILSVWFLNLVYKKDSQGKGSDEIFEEASFIIYSLILGIVFLVLLRHHAGFLDFLKR